MILIFGGTTEGRLAVEVTELAGKPYFYSTHDGVQQVNSTHGTYISGGMDAVAIASCCKEQEIRLIIDAAHPFASALHQNIATAATLLRLPVIRLERHYPPKDSRIIWCHNYGHAIQLLNAHHVNCLLALTGVKTIERLKEYWTQHDCYFRILDRDASREILRHTGFPPARTLTYSDEGRIDGLLSTLHPQAILLKESGATGGFSEKAQAALEQGVKVFAIERPTLPSSFHIATGRFSLRRMIEQLLPDFFPLRSGITTGTCAAAAAKAALASLLSGTEQRTVQITLPNDEEITLVAEHIHCDKHCATATVRKDAGDDPDVTHGTLIVARVRYASHPDIAITGGEGVGRVTLPGLGIPVGEAAINPTPRRMIVQALQQLYQGGLDVEISVPEGKALAEKTFNHRVGVVGGISIIGTSGIVQPFSNEAFIDAIRREVQVAVATGIRHVVLNSGARSERIVKQQFPHLPAQAFVHYGNAIGETLSIACQEGAETITLGLMIGKAVKLAEGHTNTHSHKVLMNTEFLKTLAADAGCSAKAVTQIGQLKMARDLWNTLDERDAPLFFTALLQRCHEHCRTCVSTPCTLQLMLISDEEKIEYTIP